MGWLARRFLLSKSSDQFLSFIAWVSVVGVGLGVFALIVVTSALNGFEAELARTISAMNGDVIFYTRVPPIADPASVESKLRAVLPEIQNLTPSFTTEMMISGDFGTAGAVVEGVELETVGAVTELPRRVIRGRLPAGDGEIALGMSLAERLGVDVGQNIRLVAPFSAQDGEGAESENAPDGALGSGPPRIWKGQVVGVVKMGMHEYDSKFAYLGLGAIQRFLKQEGKVTSYKLKLLPGTSAAGAAARLAERFGYPFRAKDWGQLNRNIFYAVQLEKVVISILLTAIMIVAAFNVISTLMMMIHEKAREISILQAMGLRSRQNFALFALIGGGIGAVGTAVGSVAGVGVVLLADRMRLIRLPADIYYIDHLPLLIRKTEVVGIVGVALLISFGAALGPAWRVSRRPPIEGIRYE